MEKKANTTLSGPGVMDKYKDAGLIAQSVLKELIEKCQPGADIKQLCSFGNKRILEETDKIYNKKKIPKGIAFPVCISPSSLCGYFSPLQEDNQQLQEGQVVKIELGVQIDSFPALLAHTVVVGKGKDEKITSQLSSCYQALQNAIKALRPGNQNYDVTNVIQTVVSAFGFKVLRGVLIHNLEQGVMDGEQVI